MIHDLDWLRYVFGEPERIFCQVLQRTMPEHIDYAMATLRMKSGLIAKVIGTWAQPSGFRVEAEVCGDKGMFQFNSDEAPLVATKRGASGDGPGMIVPASPVPASPYELEWRDFLSWIGASRRARDAGGWARGRAHGRRRTQIRRNRQTSQSVTRKRGSATFPTSQPYIDDVSRDV